MTIILLAMAFVIAYALFRFKIGTYGRRGKSLAAMSGCVTNIEKSANCGLSALIYAALRGTALRAKLAD